MFGLFGGRKCRHFEAQQGCGGVFLFGVIIGFIQQLLIGNQAHHTRLTQYLQIGLYVKAIVKSENLIGLGGGWEMVDVTFLRQ